MSDSCSVLKALSDIRNKHSVIKKLLYDIGTMNEKNKEIQMCWIPSHIGIRGNEEADQRAVAGAKRPEQYIWVYYRDWFPEIDRVIIEDWNREWESKKQKMYEVRRKIEKWEINNKVTRREEVVMNRLRSGQTQLTHGYILENTGQRVGPICIFCDNAVITVKHLLLTWP